jgi:hypothetical protein
VKKGARLNDIIAGVMLAALGLVCGWVLFRDAVVQLIVITFHADEAQHISGDILNADLKAMLAGCALLFVAVVGVALFAAFNDWRAK